MTAPRRRWLQFAFSLRTLFVVVTVCACWLGYQLNWISQRRDFIENRAPTRVYWAPSLSLPITITDPSRVDAPGMLWMFGERGNWKIAPSHRVDVDEARRLFPEAEVDLTILREDLPAGQIDDH